MNDAVYKFKRYEDASLSYTGIDQHEGENRGGWDTVISDADYNSMFALQQTSMEAPIPSADDLPEKPFPDVAEAVRDMDSSPKEKQVAEKTAVYGQPLKKPRCTLPVPKPAAPASQKQVDLSRVVVGCQLRHGNGQRNSRRFDDCTVWRNGEKVSVPWCIAARLPEPAGMMQP